jgi:hypothetical protein
MSKRIIFSLIHPLHSPIYLNKAYSKYKLDHIKLNKGESILLDYKLFIKNNKEWCESWEVYFRQWPDPWFHLPLNSISSRCTHSVCLLRKCRKDRHKNHKNKSERKSSTWQISPLSPWWITSNVSSTNWTNSRPVSEPKWALKPNNNKNSWKFKKKCFVVCMKKSWTVWSH